MSPAEYENQYYQRIGSVWITLGDSCTYVLRDLLADRKLISTNDSITEIVVWSYTSSARRSLFTGFLVNRRGSAIEPETESGTYARSDGGAMAKINVIHISTRKINYSDQQTDQYNTI